MGEYIKREDALKEVDRSLSLNEAYSRIASHIIAADVVEVKHGRWIEEHFGTLIPVEYDDNGNVIVHDCVNYRCNLCGRIENKKEPFCNCGARMDGE